MGILKDLIDVATTMSSDVDFDMDDIFNDDDNLFGSSIRRVKRCTSNDSIAKQAKHVNVTLLTCYRLFLV